MRMAVNPKAGPLPHGAPGYPNRGLAPNPGPPMQAPPPTRSAPGGKVSKGPAAPAPAAAAEPRGHRVLVLTGTASGEKIMKAQISKLIKKAEGKVQFIIYEGEHECNNPEAVEIMSKFFKGLPMKQYAELTFDARHWRCYKRLRSTLDAMQKEIAELGPFAGVLGFSQGANFAVMLAAMSYAGVGMPFSFCIPICPNAPGYADQVREFFTQPLQVPALIIRGALEDYDEGVKKTLEGKKIDTLDEPIPSEHVVSLFEKPEVFEHSEGHRPLPSKLKEQDDLISKVIQFIEEKSKVEPIVKDPHAPSGLPIWRVVEGAGGRVVRAGPNLGSAELEDTLRPGALVEELALKGSRLHYHLLAGQGPKCGWVTIKSKSGDLLVRASADAAGTTGDIWIITVGTRGDLQPFVVLGMALRAAGYNVRLFGPPELSTFRQASGLEFTTVCSGWSERSQAGAQVVKQAEQADAEGQRDWEEEAASDSHENTQNQRDTGIPGIQEPRGGWPRFIGLLGHLGINTRNGGDVVNLAWLWTEMPKTINIIKEEMEKAKPDLVIYNHLMVNVGLLAWRLYGVRSIFANLGLEFHFAPRGEDSFNYYTLGAFDRMELRKVTGGISPMRDMSKQQFTSLYNSSDRLLGTTKLIIYALPREDQLAAKDWKFTGFWIYDQEKQKEETDAFGGPEVLQKLQDFLLDGTPPVYMGWGSMPTSEKLIVTLVTALRNLGLRGVMVRGWGRLSMESLQAAAAADPWACEGLVEYAEGNVLFVDKVPHEWLLPKCCCSVHHGGAGTTAAAMRAGVPTIVVPLGYDQPVHGDWVKKLGVGLKTSKLMEIGTEEFEAALRTATTDSEMKSKAQVVSDTLKKEPGVAAAVEKVRKIMREDVRSGKAQARWEAEEEERRGKTPTDKFWQEVREEENRRFEEAKRKEEERIANLSPEELAEERRQEEERRRVEKEWRMEQRRQKEEEEARRRQQEEEERRRRQEEEEAERRQREEEEERRRKQEEEERRKRWEEEERQRKQKEEEEKLRREEEEERRRKQEEAEEAERQRKQKEEEERRRKREEEEERRRKQQEEKERRRKQEEDEEMRRKQQEAKEAASIEEEQQQVVVHIDRALELHTLLSVGRGETIGHIKQLLANEDPTGETRPQDFKLLDSATGDVLADATVIDGVIKELDLSVGNG